MGKKHFSEEQIAFALRQAESGTSVAEIIRKLGISEQTFYRWKKRFAGLAAAMGPGTRSATTPVFPRGSRRDRPLVSHHGMREASSRSPSPKTGLPAGTEGELVRPGLQASSNIASISTGMSSGSEPMPTALRTPMP